jgi:FeS assembly SUF system protein
MRSSRPWAACGRCWVNDVGIFSFLTGRKEEETDTRSAGRPAASPQIPVAEAADRSHEGAVAETGVNAAPGDAGASPGTSGDGGHAETPFHAPDAWNIDALTAPKPEVTGEKPEIGPVDPAVTAELQPKVVDVIKTVYDPEIPVDIYELGLIYGIEADAERRVLVRMTLTSPACPSAQQIPSEVRYKVKAIPGVKDAWVEIEWEPPWDKDRMSEAAKLQLGFF